MSDPADAPDEADAIADGSLIGDHFRVIRKLGAGGMGEVYLAENLHLPGKRYAVKVLRQDLSAVPRYAELLAAEARRQARLEHENIVQLYDFFPWQQRYCLIMAYVDGTTLAEIIDATPGGLPEARALDLMLDVLEGLNYAHQQGVLHCDVKPPNVLVDRENRVRVTDFGIARDVGLAASGAQLGVAGTPEYMSPEQVTDPDRVDHRADVYAAGVLLFELLTGRLPFAHDRANRAGGYPQLTETPTDLREARPDLAPELARIVATALQRDRSARFQGCVQFQQAIRAYRARQRWRRTWLPALVALALVGAAGAGGAHLWQERVRERAQAQSRMAEQRAREAIAADIGTAVLQLGTLCREARRLAAREASLATAMQAGFADLEERFRRQIGELRRNVADAERSYGASITRLTRYEPRWVGEALDARRGGEASAFVAGVRADHAARAGGRPMRGQAALLAACPDG